MPQGKLSDAEALALWKEAERRLRLVDVEPPLATARVDALLEAVGPRREGESIRAWLRRSQEGTAEDDADERPSAEIIPFNPRRQRFAPVAGITRLAADTTSGEIPLPTRELETQDGRFRLRVTVEADQVVVALEALGFAADEFAGRTVGIAPADGDVPVAVIVLDEDGDGEVRLPDTVELRRALLEPVIGLIEET